MPHSRLVPIDLDKKYRWLIVEYATNIACLPPSLCRAFEELLESPTSRPEAAEESKDAYGALLEGTLQRTSKIVDGLSWFLEQGHPGAGVGFVRWLGATGWGNDIRLIRLFEKWADEADRRKAAKRMGKRDASLLAPSSSAAQ